MGSGASLRGLSEAVCSGLLRGKSAKGSTHKGPQGCGGQVPQIVPRKPQVREYGTLHLQLPPRVPMIKHGILIPRPKIRGIGSWSLGDLHGAQTLGTRRLQEPPQGWVSQRANIQAL